MKQLWSRFVHFLYAHVLHADDTPHRIALGVGIGTCVAFTPTIGFQMAITFALCALVRANKIVGLPMAWITNPVTAVPIYLPCWKLGSWLTSSGAGDHRTVTQKLHQFLSIGEQGVLGHIFEADFWRGVLRLLMEFGLELWVGCLVVGAAAGIITYFVTRWGVTEYRQRRRVRKIYRSVMRSRVRQAKIRRGVVPRRQAAV